MKLKLIPVKTNKITPPQYDIYQELDKHLPKLKNNDVIFITSKILGIHQGRTIPMKKVPNKDDLIRQEADFYLERDPELKHSIMLTIKDKIIIASAGIDESNSNDYYVFWPKNVDILLQEIRLYLIKKYNLVNLGVISTDSKTSPLRFGVSGIATGISGVKPLRDERGTPDVFGRSLKMTQVDQITPLASMAVLCMGEAGEQTPICIVRGKLDLCFSNKASSKDFFISPEEDIYKPLLEKFYK